YNMVYVLPVLRDKIGRIREASTPKEELESDLLLIRNELTTRKKLLDIQGTESLQHLFEGKLSAKNLTVLDSMVKKLEDKYHEIYNNASEHKEQLLFKMEMNNQAQLFASMRDGYYNESLEDLLRNKTAAKKYVITASAIVPKTDPVYFNPDKLSGDWSYRTHFFSPNKQIAGQYFDTFLFNICFVWALTIVMFIILYLDVFRKIMDFKISSIALKLTK
ncbi:MAG TPA: hypothetical protein VK750_02560, partial [Cytophagaceae bacterium]|nr:hypothetical protein [Cytophagaceae bacterium]